MKPTRFMTTSQAMADCLDCRCDRSHKHQNLVGGRAAEAAFYPLPLIKAILKGIRATADSEKFSRESAEERIAYVAAISDTQGAIPAMLTTELPGSVITRTNGGKVRVDYPDSNFKWR